MKFALDGLKLVDVATLDAGTLFVPVTSGSRAAAPHVVVHGDRQVAGKFAVPLSGETPFRAHRLKPGVTKGMVFGSAGDISLETSDDLRTAGTSYERGLVAVNEEGAFLFVDWSHNGYTSDTAFVSLKTWSFAENVGHPSTCGWFSDWNLGIGMGPERTIIARGFASQSG